MSGSFFAALRDAAGADWRRYVEHLFVRGLADGTLPEAAFRHYLAQDYLFLIDFARAYGLAAYKAAGLDEIRDGRRGAQGHRRGGDGAARRLLRRMGHGRRRPGGDRAGRRHPRLYLLRAGARNGRRPARPAGRPCALHPGLRRDRRPPRRRPGHRDGGQSLHPLDRDLCRRGVPDRGRQGGRGARRPGGAPRRGSAVRRAGRDLPHRDPARGRVLADGPGRPPEAARRGGA